MKVAKKVGAKPREMAEVYSNSIVDKAGATEALVALKSFSGWCFSGTGCMKAMKKVGDTRHTRQYSSYLAVAQALYCQPVSPKQHGGTLRRPDNKNAPEEYSQIIDVQLIRMVSHYKTGKLCKLFEMNEG